MRHFTFHPSRYLILMIVMAHAVAAGAFLFVPISKIALFLLLIVLAVSMVYYVLRDAGLILGGAWIALGLEDDRVVLHNRKGEEVVGALLRSSVVTPYLVVLNIALPGQRSRRNVVLMADSMDAESFRQLRVALKWGARPTA